MKAKISLILIFCCVSCMCLISCKPNDDPQPTYTEQKDYYFTYEYYENGNIKYLNKIYNNWTTNDWAVDFNKEIYFYSETGQLTYIDYYRNSYHIRRVFF